MKLTTTIKPLILVLFLLQCSCGLWRANQPVISQGLAPIPAQAHFYKGLIEEDQKNWREAAIHFDKASNLDPQSARIHLHLGRCLLHLTMYRKGLASLKRATNYTKPDDYLMWFDLGEAYRTAGMYLIAKMCYEKSVSIFPKFQKALQALVELQNFS